MKKVLYLFLFCFFIGNYVFPQNTKILSGARVAVFPPKLIGITGNDSFTLPELIPQKLSSNLSLYTDFVMIDVTNESEIKKMQQKSEDSAFDEKTALEAGKLLSAQYVIYSSVTKAGSKYTFSCNFTNITTGEKESFIVSGKKTDEDLYGVPGCAVDEITIQLCEKLGIPLTATQVSVLRYGETNLSDAELLKMSRDQKKEETTIAKKQREEDAKKRKLERKIERDIAKDSRYFYFDQSIGNGEMQGIRAAANFSFNSEGFDEFNGFDVGALLGLGGYFSSGVFGGVIKTPKDMKDVMKHDYVGYLKLVGGVNFRPKILLYPPSIYAMAGFGVVFGERSEKHNSSDKKNGKDITQYYMIPLSAGLEFPFGTGFAVYGQANYNIIMNAENDFNIQAGIAITF